MDQEDLEQNPNNVSNEKTPTEKSDEKLSGSLISNNSQVNQVFDILEDNILPAQEPTGGEEKRSTPPQDTDLLDKKIGTFDQSPFAPKTEQVKPRMPNVPPISIPQQRPPAPTIGLYPTRPIQPVQIQPIPPAPVPKPIITETKPVQTDTDLSQPIQPAPTPKPIILDTRPEIITPEKQKRSLQDEVTAALPANLRGDKASQTKPPIVPKPGNQTTLPQSFANQVGSTNQQDRPGFGNTPREIVKPVRTYESDVAEIMSHKKTSTASIAIAENEKQKGSESLSNNEPRSQTVKKLTMVIISLLLLGGGAYGAYYLYSQSALAPVTPVVEQQKAAPGIIPSDKQVVITVESESLASVMQGLSNELNKDQAPNTIKEIIVAARDKTGKLTRVGAPEMIKVLGIKPPDILSRSLIADWMLGVYNNQNNEKSVFVVGTTNFFQNAFAGMLQWERVMADDLRQYLYPEKIEGISNEVNIPSSPIVNNILQGIDSILPSSSESTLATNTISRLVNNATGTSDTSNSIGTSSLVASTASTTDSTIIETVEPLREYVTISGRFEDRIIKNKDVRAFRLDNGEILFLYSFFDNTHFIMTDRETTMIEIVSRLEKQSFIR